MTAGYRRTASAAALLVALSGDAGAADARTRADVTCAPTAKALQYDCTIKLTDARTGAPLSGVSLTVGADMPSMPMAHNVRPARARAGKEPGVYSARIELEMHGDWALRLDIAGPFRDRIVKTMRFEPDPAADGAPARTPHKH
jgi:YtkA-like